MVSVPEDSDHIYDVPRKVISSNQGQSTVTFPTKNDRPEYGLTRHVGFEERYQRGHHHHQQQQYVEDPVNRVPNDHQLSRWHNLNPTPGKGTFVDTGNLLIRCLTFSLFTTGTNELCSA